MRFAAAAHVGIVLFALAVPLRAAEPETIKLFNGKDLTGWTFTLNDKNAKMEDVWSVEDGVIHCKGKPIGYIRTKEKYTNYKLKVEWRCIPGKPGNSGVLLRVQDPDKVWPKSVESQLNSGDAGDIWVIDEFPIKLDPARTKGRRTVKLHESSEKPLGEWNTYEITVDGGNLELKVNGVVQNTGTDFEVVPGYILLQSEGAPIDFRTVELTPIESKEARKDAQSSIFNGTDLTGWTFVAKDDAKGNAFSVKDGVLVCSGKPTGYLRSNDNFKDFNFKFDYRWTAKPGNGGIFVRTQDDQIWPKGLQAQVQDQNSGDLILMGNLKADLAPDRIKKETQQTKLQPFNEKPAGEWNTYEIKAAGDTVELKINGVEQNKLSGIAALSGHVGFQSEGSPLEFRNIELTPIESSAELRRLPGLEGWHVIGNGNWTFHDGIIEGQQTKAEKSYTHVVSDKRYKNFRATLMYKCLAGNSGFYFRSQPDDVGHMHGIQCEIDVAKDAGGFYESYGRNWVSQPEPEETAKFYKAMEWNEMKVEAIGNHVTSWINGTKAAEIDDDKQRKEGVCALQIHGGQDVHVMFKDIVVEPIGE